MLLLAESKANEKETLFTNALGIKVPGLSIEYIESQFNFRKWEARMRPSMKPTEGEQITENTYFLQRYELEDCIYTDVLMSYVTGSYQPIQFPAIYDWLEMFLEEDLLRISAALNYSDLRFAVTCDINPEIIDREVSVVENDRLFTKVIIALSHDGSLRSVHFSMFDAVCCNTLHSSQMIAMTSSRKRIVVIDSLDELIQSRYMIDLINRQFNVLDEFKKMREISLDYPQVQNILKFVNNLSPNYDKPSSEKLSKAEKNYWDMLESYNSEDVRWDASEHHGWRLYNAYTDVVKGKSVKNAETNFYSNLSNQSKRQKMKDLILSLA